MSGMMSTHSCDKGLRISSFLGFCLSYYSYVVETNMEHNPNYVAMCDITEHMSCSKAFNSEYGKGFGVIGKIFGKDSVANQPNSVPGMLFYMICFLLSLNKSVNSSKTLLIFSVVSNFMSLYLAYILYFILHDFCIVCVSTYAVNFVLFILSYVKHSQLKGAGKPTKGKDS